MMRRTAGLALTALLAPMLVLSAQAKVRFILGATGNAARYIVREQLAAATVENDAVGATSALTGGLLIDPSGKVDTSASKWTVDLTTLKSDRSMRDRYLQGRTLETAQFPTAELVVTDLKGLPGTFPTAGPLTLTLLGNFTMHGVTKATAWDVTATVAGDHVSGKATIHVKFGDFNLSQPHVPVVASVVDDIILQYDFHLIRAESPKP